MKNKERIMNIRLRPLSLILVCATFFCGHSRSLAATTYVLEGTVMDTSDNWLNGAQVKLAPVGVSTRSDANGQFRLEFELDAPLKPNKRKQIAALIVEREGHLTEKRSIKSMKFFQTGKPLKVKLKPKPVDPSLTGFTVEMKAPKGRRGTKAQFHVYIPESVEKVRAAFYISRHGMGDITKPVLRKFAEEAQLALVGMFGDPVQRGVDDVAILDEHLQRLAELSGHPELPHVPIMTFGHSNGTGFAASWPRDRPEQVIAWVAFHPGFNGYLQYPNTDAVPAMVMCGTSDKYLRNSRQDKVVAKLRKERNAAMNVMMEGGVGHAPADQVATWEFITEFLKAAMRVRLAEDGSLKPVDIKSGWLGASYDFEAGGRQSLQVAPYAQFSGETSTASWLPDARFAKIWQAYGAAE